MLEVNRQELRTALEKEKDLSELKSRFVTMASHEFRTPLSTILTSVSLISKYNDVGQDEKRFKHIDRIKSAVSNLTSILNDFLSLGKLEEGKVQYSATEFDLPVFSQDLVNEMREVSKKGQSIIYEHQGVQSIVFLDKNLTRNICINLLSNAIKYSNEGSRIDFKTIHENDKIVLEVTDHGIGIPESEQQHIFERFFRAGNASNIQGTGLGLNIVKKYVELLNGEVGFKSVYGKGTTFKVILPTKTTS
ncbi:MAG: HAMP domain-containing histidine kinase [Bacteroidetes bacterium]|nr:HAMP domain-containing histidine kinase [Bacteroidota bacterium]